MKSTLASVRFLTPFSWAHWRSVRWAHTLLDSLENSSKTGSEGRNQWLRVQLTVGNEQGLCWGSCHPISSLVTWRVGQSASSAGSADGATVQRNCDKPKFWANGTETSWCSARRRVKFCCWGRIPTLQVRLGTKWCKQLRSNLIEATTTWRMVIKTC